MIDELYQYLKSFFETSKLNLLHENYGGRRIFSDPIIGVARGDDPIFQKFKEVVGPEHLSPRELWLAEGQENLLASNLRIISIVFPYVDKIRKESKNVKKLLRVTLPAEIYSVGRNYANIFKQETCKKIIEFFNEKSYKAVAGMLSESFTIMVKGNFYSTWSERHMAFATGLGTFSLHGWLITDVGCNIRLASVVTDAPFKITQRKNDDPYANCLYYSKGTCRECEKRCPANAIDENGHNKIKCRDYGQKIARKIIARIGPILKPHIRCVNWKLRPPSYPVGCAFCQFEVPCMDKNPTAKM
ncbi:MAG: hypothetical protein CEE43_05885 [Promethearchaeota archaeon Loki_b32]|nr:MAG: hypothetical protein CEE43_05885 [Candidatus Lokiarchaeota archaeon Loki_b32]